MEKKLYSRRQFVGVLGALGATTLLGLTGCASNAASNDSGSSTETGSNSNETPNSGSNSGRVLVAYYSATGHTRPVAERLANDLGATLFEITPSDPFSSDDLNFNNPDSRVSQEHENPDQRDTPLAQTTPDNFDQYSTVLLGYPIWWGEEAWPIDHFVTDNDFSGKRVITFCTSESSGLGSTTSKLSGMAQTGDWEDGRRFAEHPSQSDIDSWAQSLGL